MACDQLTDGREASGLPRWMTPLLHWYGGTQTELRSKHCDAGGAVGGGGGMYSFRLVGGGGGGDGTRMVQQTSLAPTLHCYNGSGRNDTEIKIHSSKCVGSWIIIAHSLRFRLFHHTVVNSCRFHAKC